jgi:hypothetical protein
MSKLTKKTKHAKPVYETKRFLRTFIGEMWSADISVTSKTVNPLPLLLPDVTHYQFYDQLFVRTGDDVKCGEPKGFTKLTPVLSL